MTEMFIVRGLDPAARMRKALEIYDVVSRPFIAHDPDTARQAVIEGYTVIVEGELSRIECPLDEYYDIAQRCDRLVIYDTSGGLEDIPSFWRHCVVRDRSGHRFINLTPHSVTLRSPEFDSKIGPSGLIARVTTVKRPEKFNRALAGVVPPKDIDGELRDFCRALTDGEPAQTN